MNPEELKELVKAAFVEAKAYVDKDKSKLLQAIEDPQKRNEVRAVLDRGYAGNENLEAAVSAIISDCLDEKKPNQSNDGRYFTYLAGANPSTQLLLAKVHGNIHTPEIHALRATLETGVQFNFQEAKKKFTELTGENLDGDNYAKFRGLFAGMDKVVAGYANEQKLDIIHDETLAPEPAKWESVIQRMAEEGKGGKLTTVVAMALTPEQAATKATDFGIPAKEAASNAQRFAAFFPEMIKKLPQMDIILLNEKFEPIFVRKNGDITVNNELAMTYWKGLSVNPPSTERPPGTPLPAAEKACTPN
jgi:hypothetical protein